MAWFDSRLDKVKLNLQIKKINLGIGVVGLHLFPINMFLCHLQEKHTAAQITVFLNDNASVPDPLSSVKAMRNCMNGSPF